MSCSVWANTSRAVRWDINLSPSLAPVLPRPQPAADAFLGNGIPETNHKFLSRKLHTRLFCHLIGLGEVVARLGRGFAERLYRPVQVAEGFTDGNQLARVDAAWLILPCGADKTLLP